MNWFSLIFSVIKSFFSGTGSNDSNKNNIIIVILFIITAILLLFIGKLQNDKKDLQIMWELAKNNNIVLETIIADQNEAIENSRANYQQIANEFGRLGNVLDKRYSELVIKEGNKFKQAQCDDKLDMLVQSFNLFKIELNKEIQRETANKVIFE